ncbi:MAG TPA: MarP family serine protease [Microthrixaceae bacterium]|nr:MarP family serine protease [Microthrixaceae bacterium]
MNGLDLLIGIAACAAVIGGWSLGFLRRLSGWIGAAAGIALAIYLTPILVRHIGLPSDPAILAFGAAVFVLLTSAGQSLGGFIGSKVRSGVTSTVGDKADSFGGALLGVVGVAVVAWLVVPVMAQASGWPAATVRGSAVAQVVTDHFPAPPGQISQIERELAGGEFPKIFEGLRQAPEVPKPPLDSPLPQAAIATATRSVVRVEAPACGRIQSGSGFFVGNGLVVTNAHVVAGSEQVSLDDSSGTSHQAEVIHFDPKVDLALISTSFDRPAFDLAPPQVGDAGLVMGFPGGGELAPSPFSVGKRINAKGYDIYDGNLVTRDLLVLASELQPGDSGSAVVRKDGSAIGVAVAIAPDNKSVAYAISSDTLRTVMAQADPSVADTGPCT